MLTVTCCPATRLIANQSWSPLKSSALVLLPPTVSVAVVDELPAISANAVPPSHAAVSRLSCVPHALDFVQIASRLWPPLRPETARTGEWLEHPAHCPSLRNSV